ncbi:hypothetical protein XELAEV_18024780mg [Xenopus laevis]|uniref:ribonuclease H n=1 Tax=Xenopus laevis TaxID=8355 RepID=A0A974D142_XENLA|nr:hypothetical protein XELAEV_18024780mg [Xenopus laevis]
MGNTSSKPTEGIPAMEIVKRREGTKAVKDYDKLAKICDFTPNGPRLQPENWRILVAERRGLLRDKGLLESAEAWLRVARDLHKEFWSEQRVIKPNGKIKYLYHKEPPFPCMVNMQPPPYDGAHSTTGSPATAPSLGGSHFTSPATTPSLGGSHFTSPATAPSLGGSHFVSPATTQVADGGHFETTNAQATLCSSNPFHPSATPLYPVLTAAGQLYTPTLKGPAPIMISGEEDVSEELDEIVVTTQTPVSSTTNIRQKGGATTKIKGRIAELRAEEGRPISQIADNAYKRQFSQYNPWLTISQAESTPLPAPDTQLRSNKYLLPQFDPGVTQSNDDQLPTPIRGGIKGMKGAPVLYVTFTPSQASTLIAQLPDPDHQPMPFYCRLAQIQKNYSATWRDLESLCEIKAGDAYWPLMKNSLANSTAHDFPHTSYESGVEFCDQIKTWAQNRLADQAVNIHDILQDKAESVEKFQVRLLQVFDDLGFNRYNKPHAQMLSSAFVGGLKDHIKKGLIIAHPEYRTLPLDTLALVAKGLEASQSKSKTTPLMVADTTPAGQKQGKKGSCYHCGKPGHHKYECRALQRANDEANSDLPHTSTPRYKNAQQLDLGKPVSPTPVMAATSEGNGHPTTFLIDTGTARSVIRTQDLPHQATISDLDISCVGVDGTPRKNPLTCSLQVGSFSGLLARFVVSPTCPMNLIGTDLLSRMQAKVVFLPDGSVTVSTPLDPDETSTLCSIPLLLSADQDVLSTSIPDDVLARIPPALWSQGPEDIGRLHMPPVVVHLKEGASLPRKPQYPLKPAQSQAITKQLQTLLANGAIIQRTSPCNTPLFPVKKKGKAGEPDKYRLVQDLRAVNDATIMETPLVSNPHTILSGIPPSSTYFTVVDLTNAFYCIPLHEDCWYLFAFTHEHRQYVWTVLPQGAQNSPTHFSLALTSILDSWRSSNPTVTLLQYVDDLLLCSSDLRSAESASESLLHYLAAQGCKASREKLQWCQLSVVFLGQCISQGTRHITQERVKTLEDIALPLGHKPLHAFLGLISYCRAWIPEASLLMQPLYDVLKSNPFTMTPEAANNFATLKHILSTAPALGLPDYEKPFKLFVSERQGHAFGVLTQSHGSRLRPIGYFSGQLDNVAKGSPSCMRAVYAANLLLDKTSDIILGHECILLAPHDITAILNQTQPKHMSAARHLRLQCSMLIPDNVTLQRCTILNPSTLLPIPEGGEDGSTYDSMKEAIDSHDCFELMQQETSHLHTVSAHPLENPDISMFVDGSRFADDTGKFHAGYAVTTTDTVLKAEPLPSSFSAQEAELKALTAACQLAEGKRVNIHTDSRYAQGVALDFGVIWKTRGYLTATGTPIKHGKSVADLMNALLLPEQVAILKVKAHGRLASPEALGNHMADQTAKTAALGPLQELTTDVGADSKDMTPLLQVGFIENIEMLKTYQANATPFHGEPTPVQLQANHHASTYLGIQFTWSGLLDWRIHPPLPIDSRTS